MKGESAGALARYKWSALIPVKEPRLGKSRLNAVLGEAERIALNLSLACRTFDICAEAMGAAACVVVTSSGTVSAEAARRGLRVVPEPSDGGLNRALAAAGAAALASGAQALVVVPTDLVRLGADALRAVIDALPAGGGCVLAPDRHGTGTNAMALAPGRVDLFRFGADSLLAHRDVVAAAGLALATLEDARLALDLDLPEDLELWRAAPGSGRLQKT